MSTHTITVTVNGQPHTQTVEARLLLVHLIRENLHLTGTHIGCDTTHCGACTVLLDDIPVKDSRAPSSARCSKGSKPSTGCSAATARRA